MKINKKIYFILLAKILIINSCGDMDFRDNPPVPVPKITSINIIDTANHNNKIEFTLYNEIWAHIEIFGENLNYTKRVTMKDGSADILEISQTKLVVSICCWIQPASLTIKLLNSDDVWTQEYGSIVVE